jgi:hypothetical protein
LRAWWASAAAAVAAAAAQPAGGTRRPLPSRAGGAGGGSAARRAPGRSDARVDAGRWPAIGAAVTRRPRVREPAMSWMGGRSVQGRVGQAAGCAPSEQSEAAQRCLTGDADRHSTPTSLRRCIRDLHLILLNSSCHGAGRGAAACVTRPSAGRKRQQEAALARRPRPHKVHSSEDKCTKVQRNNLNPLKQQ